jgi:CubicO group peptidase (beta-lactamase class C family)
MPPAVLVTVLLVSTLLASRARAAEPVEALLRQRAEAFVAAMNASDRATLEAFARDHLESRVAREGHAGGFAERMIETRAELGPIERHAVQVLRGGALVFVYCKHATGGSWQNYQFRVVAGDDHRLQLVFRAVAVEPLERPSAPLASEEAGRWLRQFQASLEQQQPFSGVALVRSRGKEAYSLVKGTADASKGSPVTRQSRFGMASGSKMFTAVAILQLAQRGRLSLGDPLARHLPGFANRGFAQRTTLHQLLTHTAGAGNYWDDAYEREWGSITELRQMLPFVLTHLGASPAGEFSYSNSGYVLLGLVIEAVSGTSYYDYVRQNLLEPAGMASTGFPLRTDPTPHQALPYEPEMDAGAVKPGVYVPVTLGARGSSAGGASTTVDDLLRFVDALRGGTLLDATHLDLMTRGHVSYGGPDSWYGYGTIVDRDRGVQSWGHGGMAPGTHFELKVYPDRDAVMVVMSNYNTIAGPEMASALDHLVRNPER